MKISTSLSSNTSKINFHTKWTSVNFNTHWYEIIPLSRIKAYITCYNWIWKIISNNSIIVFITNKILNSIKWIFLFLDFVQTTTNHNDLVCTGIIKPIMTIIRIHYIEDCYVFFCCTASLCGNTCHIVPGTQVDI